MKKHQEQIKKVYKNLGKQYLRDISRINVSEIPDFIKQIPKGGTVLDVGCAGGRDSAKFIKAGFKVVGIDLVEEFINTAKKKVPRGEFKVMDLLDIKLPAKSFNGIWANAVLLHVEKKDIPKVLKSFFRILKDGGLVHIRVKRGRDSKVIVDKLSQNTGRNFTLFFKQELEKYFKDAGFKIVQSKIFLDEAKRKKLKWVGIWATK